MEVYENSAYCFSCGYYTKDVDVPYEPKPKTDIGAEIEYIRTLPTREIRGLQLHYDYEGFYILWPDLSFYKKRLNQGRIRYLGPSGHRTPLFKIQGRDPKTLLMVEGELNALSLSLSIGDLYTIVSPGASTNIMNYMPYYCTFDSIYAIVDKDVSGVVNGLKLKEELINRKKRVVLEATDKDYNQILQEEGTEGVKEIFDRRLGLPRELPVK
ncbi:MAG: hypothetical protein NVS1B10_03180 [Candidatus Saccharimonadales bacterium]